eukprot:10161.XXX_242436_242654_1 [CDS] Oithona nana genome sequencing.
MWGNSSSNGPSLTTLTVLERPLEETFFFTSTLLPLALAKTLYEFRICLTRPLATALRKADLKVILGQEGWCF